MSGENEVIEENKMDEESAEHEFSRFAKSMGLDDQVDEQYMDAESLDGFLKIKRRVISGIQKGDIVVNDIGEIIVTPANTKNAEPIQFFTPKGAVLSEMDRKKEGHNIGKMNNVVGAMTKKNPGYIANLHIVDYRLVTDIGLLFLA